MSDTLRVRKELGAAWEAYLTSATSSVVPIIFVDYVDSCLATKRSARALTKGLQLAFGAP